MAAGSTRQTTPEVEENHAKSKASIGCPQLDGCLRLITSCYRCTALVAAMLRHDIRSVHHEEMAHSIIDRSDHAGSRPRNSARLASPGVGSGHQTGCRYFSPHDQDDHR